MPMRLFACVMLVLCLARPAAASPPAAFPEPPAGNRPGPAEGRVRPPSGDLDARAKLLFEAIQKDAPSLAEPVFFPASAFDQVKAMPKPGRYYARLHARFHTDIHALHRAHPELARAVFARVALGRRGGWVAVGDEGNRLPNWAARHARLTYTLDGALRELEVRVLITWDDRWYVIHLSEFTQGASTARP